MNIEGLSEATLEKFINKGWLQKFDDIYYIDEHKSEIVRMDGFGLKSYNKLIESIEKSKNVKFENFLASLGIEGVGLSTAKLLSKRFKTIDNLLGANRVDFMNIDGIGEITAKSIYEYRLLHIGTIQCLRDKINIIEENKKETSLKDLTGQIFVITGSVNTFKNRDEFKELVELLNGKVTGSVTSKTNYLVNNDVSSTSGKNKTAKDLGVKIISEQQFNEMIGRIN
jgi:DNA ligase (NAD+)